MSGARLLHAVHGPALRAALWALAALALGSCAVDVPTNSGPVSADQPNQLVGHALISTAGVVRAERIADGALSPLGDFWNTGLTAILPPGATITVDLGAPVNVAAAFLEGDNNDKYLVAGSLDGQSFSPIWEAQPVAGAGMRPRRGEGLSAQARYIRLSASGGDGAYSVGELAIFSKTPSVWPAPASGNGPVEGPLMSEHILFFGVACMIFLLFGCQGGARRAAVVGALPAIATIMLLAHASGDRTFNEHDVSQLRAVTALVGLAAVLRPFMFTRGAPLNHRRITALLGVVAALAVACFFNLGRAQFYDAKLRQPSYVHNYDMRVYFPVAKYFHELHYDGLYLASVAAYVENTPGASLQSLADVELRDLRTHNMRRVRDVTDEIQSIHTRFSAQRWDEFKQDMRYFHETMGRDYFSTLVDHGGNATPVWLLVAHLMFGHASAGNGLLLATAMLDPLLILLFAIVVGRTFGWKTSFVCLIVFGANDIYMFGTDWAGSTLRNDWMVAVGLGAAALKKQRWYLAGALLAYGGMIRAFPAIAVLGMAVPVLWWIGERAYADKRLPKGAEIWRAHAGTLKAFLACGITVAVLAGLSAAVLGPTAWIGWAKKAAVLTSGNHVNHVSLTSVMAADLETAEMLDNWQRVGFRFPLFLLATVIFIVLTLRAGRNRPPHQASLAAMMLLPVVTYVANYYFHFIFLLPLLASTEGETRRDATIWGALLGMCVLEYGTTLSHSWGAAHFVGESAILLVTFLVILVVMVRDDRSTAAAAVVDPAAAA